MAFCIRSGLKDQEQLRTEPSGCFKIVVAGSATIVIAHSPGMKSSLIARKSVNYIRKSPIVNEKLQIESIPLGKGPKTM